MYTVMYVLFEVLYNICACTCVIDFYYTPDVVDQIYIVKKISNKACSKQLNTLVYD